MPIRLDIKPYCVNCPHIKAEVKTEILDSTDMNDYDDISVGYTTVGCSNKKLCEYLLKYLEKTSKGKES